MVTGIKQYVIRRKLYFPWTPERPMFSFCHEYSIFSDPYQELCKKVKLHRAIFSPVFYLRFFFINEFPMGPWAHLSKNKPSKETKPWENLVNNSNPVNLAWIKNKIRTELCTTYIGKHNRSANNNVVFETFKKFDLNLSKDFTQIVGGVIVICWGIKAWHWLRKKNFLQKNLVTLALQ